MISFVVGAYGFNDPKKFIVHAKKLLIKSNDVYISHIILSMILNGENFKYSNAHSYIS